MSSALDAVNANFLRASTARQMLERNRQQLSTEIDADKLKQDQHAKCLEIFKSWLESSIESNINSISDLATEGLRNILNDQEMVFRIKQEHRNNKLWMKFMIESDGVEGDPLTSYGGGAAMICSLVLRISMMKRLGLCDLLLLDETMVAVSNAYVGNTAEFMRTLAEKAGIHILMVTHNQEFVDNSHVAYEGSKTDHLKLRRIKGATP